MCLLNGINPAFLDDVTYKIDTELVGQVSVIANSENKKISLLASFQRTDTVSPIDRCSGIDGGSGDCLSRG